MGIKCRIIRNPQTGKIENVEAPNGEQSQLYKDALEMTQNEEEALDLWATSYIDEFKEIYGNSENPMRVQDTVRFQQPQDNDIRFQIISEKGAQKVKKYKNLLDKAKELEKNNVSLSDITDQTGWFKYKGQWRFFSNEALEQFDINEDAIKENTEQKLSDILSADNILFTMYPSLSEVKIIVKQDPNLPKDGSYNEGGKVIKTNRFKGRELEAVIAHEIAHFIQNREGLPQGGDYNNLLQQLFGQLDFIPKNTRLTVEEIKDLLRQHTTKENRAITESIRSLIGDTSERNKYRKYRAILGEMDAHMVSKAYTNREAPYTYLELLDEELIEQGIQDSDVIEINSKGEVSFSPQQPSKQAAQEIINQLQKTGLAQNVYLLNSQQIEDKLKELGVSEEVRQQVIAYHGTVREFNKFEQFTPTEQKFGKVLSGTYFGEDFIAFNFAGGTPFSSPQGRVIKAKIDDSSFYTVDMKGTTPSGDTSLINTIGQQEFDKILELKEKGEIQGLRLTNTREFLAGETKPTTQYVVYDNNLVEQIKEYRQEQADIFRPKFQQLQKAGIQPIPNGFVINNEVFLNEASMSLETPIHEFSHLYNSWLKQNRPEVYKKGLDLVKAELNKSSFDLSGVRTFDYLVPTEELDKIKEFDRTEATRGEEYFKELKEDIRKFGIRTPITFIRQGGKMIINEGNHRLRAAKELGIKEIPVVESKYSMSKEQLDKAPDAISLDMYKVTLPQMQNRENVIDNRNIQPSEIQDVIDFVKQSQPNLEGERLEEEVLAELVGRRGLEKIEESKQSGIIEWLKEAWQQIKQMLGISQMSTKEILDLNLQQYADAMATDLLSGESLFKNTIKNEAEYRNRKRWNPSRGYQTLEGAPIIKTRENVAGADPELTYWAHEYARRKGIEYKRQGSYVEVDENRAKRIAEAYENMEHTPQDPKVKEAYENLINQTIEQYKVLEEAGYEFYFYDETNDPYNGSPWAAMEDLRNNKRMAVFATEAGYGSNASDLNVQDNPMLAVTEYSWDYKGSPKRVLANDLFRAVHDAFGHGLEGAGFRARGEENAWQAHSRLFTGSAIAAITSETRGQNSWLNFGKYGEQNRTASVEDTIFADQKTGLMPEWTWKEGKAEDMKSLENLPEFGSQEFRRLEPEQKANILGYTLNPKGSKVADINGFKFDKRSEVSLYNVVDESILSPKEKAILKASGIRTIKMYGGRGESEGTAFYNINTNQVYINVNNDIGGIVFTDQQEVNRTIIHEAIHSIISNTSNQELINEELAPIKEKLIANKNNADEYIKRIIYHIENGSNEEVLTYMLTTPELAEFMSTIPSTKAVGYIRNLWLQFIDSIKSILGTNTLLNEALEVLDKYTQDLNIETLDSNTNDVSFQTKPSKFVDQNGEAKLDNVLDFLRKQQQPQELQELTLEEKVTVGNILRTKQINSTELKNELNNLFKGGKFNREALDNSNIFSRAEQIAIRQNEEYIDNLKELSQKEIDVEDTVDFDPNFLVLDGTINKYGLYNTKNPLTIEEQIKEAVADTETYEEFSNKFNSLDYPDLVDKFNQDEEFAFNMFMKFSPLKKMVKLNQELQPTFKPNKKTEIEFSMDIGRFNTSNTTALLNISEAVWNESETAVQKALEAIETDAIKAGIDLEGLSFKYYTNSKQEFDGLFLALQALKENPEQSTLDAFLESYEEFFDIQVEEDVAIENVDINLRGRELQKIDDRGLSEYELFEQEGLIKVAEGTYQKLEKVSLDNLYEMVYAEAVTNDNRVLPNKAYFNSLQVDNQRLQNPQNKQEVLNNIRIFIENNVSKPNLGIDTYNSEVAQQLLLYKYYFEAPVVIQPQVDPTVAIREIEEFSGDTNYLATSFHTDFQVRKLQEKRRDSEAYNNFYKHFTVDQNGLKLIEDNRITLQQVKENMPESLREDFENYAVISRNQSIKDIVDRDVNKPSFSSLNSERNFYQNNIDALEIFRGDYQNAGQGRVVTTEYSKPFLRIGNKLYERENGKAGTYFYSQIDTNNGNFAYIQPQGIINKFAQSEIKSYIRSQQNVERNSNLYTKEELEQINEKHFNCGL